MIFKFWRNLFIGWLVTILAVLSVYLLFSWNLETTVIGAAASPPTTLNLAQLNRVLNVITARAAAFQQITTSPTKFADPAI